MAIIYKETGSLASLLHELEIRGISGFHTLGEILLFQERFQEVKKRILENTRSRINNEVIERREKLRQYRLYLEEKYSNLERELDQRIESYRRKSEKLISVPGKNILLRTVQRFRHRHVSKKLRHLEENKEDILKQKTADIREKISREKDEISQIFQNKESILTERSKPELDSLHHVRHTLEELHPLLAGAIGEERVVQEISKLPDHYILINDYSLRFRKPLYDKRKQEWIYSVQLDHVLIAPAGVFLLETKNWSRASMKDQDLWSPVKQIQRHSYALFRIMNSDQFRDIKNDPWGEVRIPIRNLLVMIRHKPGNHFRYVKVLKVDELIPYVTRFDDLFTPDEVNRIAEGLLELIYPASRRRGS